MSKEIETTDSTELAKDAINYVLERIKRDENIRYHIGAFTEAFERLKTAHAALTGISPEAIEAEIFGHKLSRKPAAKKLDEVKTLVQEHADNYDDKAQLIAGIESILR
ncbi:MAG TPA: hypothetical protein VNN22_07985 [Verrucomicrobiae bacterium]|nr:hypothetical protein [Verrucomicrobiae bacterium]